MGKRGPPPKPSAQKRLEGTYRADRAAREEFVPCAGKPERPDWLDKEARAEWDRIIPELEAKGLLSPIHGSAIADLCSAHSTAVKGQRRLDRQGLVILTHLGPKPNPLVAIIREARAQANLLRREFGLTPSAATRVSVPKKAKEDSAEKFLFGSGKFQVVKGGKNG